MIRIGEERNKILQLLENAVTQQECRVLRWSDWKARRIYSSQILSSLGIDKKVPQYAGEQRIREMNCVGKMEEVVLRFTGYNVPGYEGCIVGVTQRQTSNGIEVQGIELRKFSVTSFPSHLQNLRRQ